jgi:tRNA A-37 threonylcarbamoyl transferase component Bud32
MPDRSGRALIGGTLCLLEMPIEIRPIKIIRVAEGESPAAWRDVLAQPGWADAARILKEDAGSWVRRATLLDRDVVVKCRPLKPLARRFKHAIGMGHAHKHWRGAERLNRAKVATGKPLVIMRARVDGAESEFLVLEYVEGKTLLDVLDEIARGAGPPVREQHAIARAVGKLILRMIESRLYNRDPKPSNLIVRNIRAEVEICVIDAVGIDHPIQIGLRHPSITIHDIETYDMLQSLAIEAIGCGCPPRRSLAMRTLHALLDPSSSRTERHRDLRGLITEVTDGIDRHGDPRPRVNPLQPR